MEQDLWLQPIPVPGLHTMVLLTNFHEMEASESDKINHTYALMRVALQKQFYLPLGFLLCQKFGVLLALLK